MRAAPSLLGAAAPMVAAHAHILRVVFPLAVRAVEIRTIALASATFARRSHALAQALLLLSKLLSFARLGADGVLGHTRVAATLLRAPIV